MNPGPPRARSLLTFHRQVADDLAALADHGPPVLDAVTAVLDDLARVTFDLPGQRPPRIRLVYCTTDTTTRNVLAVGLRDHHAIYQAAVRRPPN